MGKPDVVPDDVEIGGLQGAVLHKMIAPADHHFPIFAGVRIGNRGNLRNRDRASRITQQRVVQPVFGGARLWRWHEFRTRQIDLQKFVGDKQLSRAVAIEQMVAAGEPEVVLFVQLCAPFSSPVRSRCSLGAASSPTTSRNSNARVWLVPSRGRSVRNASRMAPFSKRRVTATSTPGGWSQSDATKSISSSAAGRAIARSGAPNRLTSCTASISTTDRRSASLAS